LLRGPRTQRVQCHFGSIIDGVVVWFVLSVLLIMGLAASLRADRKNNLQSPNVDGWRFQKRWTAVPLGFQIAAGVLTLVFATLALLVLGGLLVSVLGS
jgi:hypothetical protein